MGQRKAFDQDQPAAGEYPRRPNTRQGGGPSQRPAAMGPAYRAAPAPHGRQAARKPYAARPYPAAARGRRGRRQGRALPVILVVLLLASLALGGYALATQAGGPAAPSAPSQPVQAPAAAAATGGPPWVVALDAGHGGGDVGAIGLVNELELVEPTVQKLYALLEADPDFTPVLTRQPGEGRTNTERVDAAKAAGAQLLLSIHGNSDQYASTSGFECFPVPPGRTWHAESLRFAGLLAEEMGAAGAGLRGEGGVRFLYFDAAGERQVHEASDTTVTGLETFGLLEKAGFATVLAEQCFITNTADVAAFAGEAGTQRAAQAYYQAIRRYFSAA